ncbi:4Fe-4S binding protein [Candidatus Bathyarchaeota archaeon]|nr:4Fe-4S binding protein [Candidatus Bathyarchaeota archaeon]
MKQITILSGKGGTGKTTISASLAALAKNVVVADCDIDAPNLHLLLKPDIQRIIEFKGLKLARINSERCIQCGLCEKNCRFEAIHSFHVDPIRCEGCKVCAHICPTGAIELVERVCGQAYISKTNFGSMSHALLNPGMENSGKLVSLVRQNAKDIAKELGIKLIIIDGPPGIGCPVIASLADVDASVLVVEPTVSGIHDLKRALKLIYQFKVEPFVCINKYDLNPSNMKNIEDFCVQEGIEVIGHIPFDHDVIKAMVTGLPVVEYAPRSPASRAIKDLWNLLEKRI